VVAHIIGEVFSFSFEGVGFSLFEINLDFSDLE